MLKELIAGFVITSLSAVIHTLGLVLLAVWLKQHPMRLAPQFSVLRYTQQLATVFGVITLLHMAETAIWAAFYYWRGLFNDFETSWYFSIGTYTTIGYGDVVLPANWRLLGGVEGINGVLLCGLSAAFLFLVVIQMFQTRVQQQVPRSGPDDKNDVS